MKIFNDDCVYVQLNDIAYLNSFDLPIPASIYMKVFGRGVTIINNGNRYNFVRFDDESEIDFFKGLDWMIDYDEVKNLSCDEIGSMCMEVAREQTQIVEAYNDMPVDEKRCHSNMINKCQLLEFKFYSLRDFLWFKQGNIHMTLPEGIDYPKGYCKKKVFGV